MSGMRPNRVKQKLAAGEPVLSVGGIDSPDLSTCSVPPASTRSGSRPSTGPSTSAASPT